MKLKLRYDIKRDCFCLAGRVRNPGEGWERLDGEWITCNPVRASLWRRYAGSICYGMLEKIFSRYWTYHAADGMTQKDLVKARSVRPAEYEDFDIIGQLWWRIKEAKYYRGELKGLPVVGAVELAGIKKKEADMKISA